ncbi:MAG TPA: polyphenol oxidase family protein [Thermoanaerobaculaceae bacterium]|nr:polyphenol oxidase family protein [Thermoanaerobaculaceae bacterium]
MAQTADEHGVIAVALGDALVLFGDATGTPASLDSRALAAAAGEAVQRSTGRAVPILYARQEHTHLTFTFSAAEPLAAGPHLVGTCDALLTTEPWTALTVRTADCLPIALAGGGAIAMVHAGWRGLAADVLGAVLGRLRAEFGVRSSDLRAVIGVGVGPCHYRVGAEVIAALSRHPVESDEWRGDGTVDLARWAAGRLLALGVSPGAIEVLPRCTACSPSYHSYRRDGERAGRQWSAVLLTLGGRPSTPEPRVLPNG